MERAHILSQPLALLHLRTHVAMLGAGIRRHDRREFEGTPADLVVARTTLSGEHLAACAGP